MNWRIARYKRLKKRAELFYHRMTPKGFEKKLHVYISLTLRHKRGLDVKRKET